MVQLLARPKKFEPGYYICFEMSPETIFFDQFVHYFWIDNADESRWLGPKFEFEATIAV